MANLQNYAKALAYVNGALLSQEFSLSVRRTSGSQPVYTTATGYSGESPGAAMCELDISNAVPAADFEFNPGPFMKSLKLVTLTIQGPTGVTLTFKGQIYEDNFTHAVNQEAKLEFRARGQFVDWQS